MSTYTTPFVTITALATPDYTSGDALGELFTFTNVPEHGTIMSSIILDRDDLGLETEMYISGRAFTGAADNEAFDITDDDLQNCVGIIALNTWFNFANNQICSVDNIGLPYWAPGGVLHCQLITRGANNLTAADTLRVALGIVY